MIPSFIRSLHASLHGCRLKMSPVSISVQASSCVKPFTCPTIPKREDWEAFRGIITYLYQECDHRLQDVIDTMLHEFNFRAT